MTIPLKFRAWNKKEKSMLGVIAIDWENQTIRERNQYRFVSFEDIITLQFTGQTDINGKDIYVGDIVEAIASSDHKDSNCISDVIQETSGTFSVRSRDEGIVYPHGLELKWWKSLKVIGNIYENSNIL